jgi:thiosulfate dehydrogenase (quinone) large subunit
MTSESTNPEPLVRLRWIALLRIMIGLVILTSWLSNVFKGYYTPDGLLYFFTQVFPQSENPLGWYAAFINGVILPIRGVFAPFQLVGEFILGLALLLGLFTRLFSVIGIFFLINTFLATFGHDWPWAYIMPIAILGVVFATRAGLVLGLDGWIHKRVFHALYQWGGVLKNNKPE